MHEANYFLFAVQVLRRKSIVYILNVPQGEDEWNSKWKTDTKGENPKNISPSVNYIILNISLGKVYIK